MRDVQYGMDVGVFAAVSQQYSSGSVASHAGDVHSTVPGCSSCSHDNASVSCCTVTAAAAAAAAAGLWCSPVGHQSSSTVMAHTQPLDAWQTSSSDTDSQQDLAELFSRIGLGKYTDIFQQQEVC